MLKKILLIVVAALAITLATGCTKKSEPAPAAPEVKITEENLDAELEKMEAQIEADIAAEQ